MAAPAAVPNDPNVGLINTWILGEAQVEGSIVNAINGFFDPTGGLPVSPALYDRYISQATANGWLVNNIYYWNGEIWAGELPAEGQQIYVSGGATFPTRFVYYTGAAWAPVPNGNVSGPGVSTDTAIVRWSGATGSAIENSVVTVSNAGTITLPDGEGIVIGTTPVVAGYTGNNIALATTLPVVTTGIQNVAIGGNSLASLNTGNNNIGIGVSSGVLLDSGENNIALGIQALQNVTSGFYNIGIGTDSGINTNTGNYTISIGTSADAYNSLNGIALGTSSIVDAQGAIAIGNGCESRGANSTCIGHLSSLYGDQNLVAGVNSIIAAAGAATTFLSAVGSNNSIDGDCSNTAIVGNGNVVTGSTINVTVGNDNIVSGSTNNIIVGRLNSITNTANSILIGTSIVTNTYTGVVSVGGNTINSSTSFAAGVGNKVSQINTTSLGIANESAQVRCTTVGYDNKALQADSMAIGSSNTANAVGAIAVGENNSVTGVNSFALGSNNTVSGQNSGAFGDSITVSADNYFIFGNTTNAYLSTPGFIQAGQKEGASTGNLTGPGVTYNASPLRLQLNNSVTEGFYSNSLSGVSMISYADDWIQLLQSNRLYLCTANAVIEFNNGNPPGPATSIRFFLIYEFGPGPGTEIEIAQAQYDIQTGTTEIHNLMLVGTAGTTATPPHVVYVRIVGATPSVTATVLAYRLTATMLS